RQDLQQRLLGSASHVSLLRVQSDGIKDWPALLDRLGHEPHVVAAAPAIYEQVLISRGPRARGAVLKGMIPTYERKGSDLLNSVKSGPADALEEEVQKNATPSPASSAAEQPSGTSSASTPSQSKSPDDLADVQQRVASMQPIILGKDMADELGATVGSIVLVTSPQGELTPFGLVPKYSRFRVVGIFQSAFYDYDPS